VSRSFRGVEQKPGTMHKEVELFDIEVRLATRISIQGCIQKFPDWLPGATAANVTALCH
jgi:hypothetical protein